MSRLVIFAKGNLDVKDTLHSLTINGQVLWNGVNEIVRTRFAGKTIRVRHETWTRSDALLAATGDVPGELAERKLELAPYPLRSQFSKELFESIADVFVLSLQPDVTTTLFRHRTTGHLFYACNWEKWLIEDRRWFQHNFIEAAALDVEHSMRNFASIVQKIRARSQAPILVYNLSSVIPGETIYNYEALDECYSTRIRRFNLALIELSRQTGISIVDVDRVVARIGADRVKLDAVHLNAEGCRLVSEEVVTILEDLGVLTEAEA
jgi:hypothetical protein